MKTAQNQARETQEKIAGYIEGYLNRVMQPGQVTELRVLEFVERGYKNTYSGYFSDYAELAKQATFYSGRALGVYIVMNPIHPALLGRAANRMQRVTKDTKTTADENIVSLNWLLIDVDPDKPDSSISATDDEKRIAEIKRDAIADYLTDRGWPEGIKGDSGNGAHLVYPIEQMENNSDNVGILQNCLQALRFWFDPADDKDKDGSKVDQKVFNPSRIWKLYGTRACKGDPIDGRPHRLASLGKDHAGIPDTLIPVSLDLLSSLAADAPTPKTEPADGNRTPYTGSGLEGEAWMDDWIGKHGIGATKKDRSYGVAWVLDQCPFNAEHTDRAAFITYSPGRGFGAGCHHNGCKGKGWQELRTLYDGPKETRYKTSSNGTGAGRYDGQDTDGGKGAMSSGSTVDSDTGEILPDDLAMQDQDDTGNAHCVKALYPGKYVYTKTHGWLVFDGMKWETDIADAYLMDDVSNTLIERQRALRAIGEDPRGKVIPNTQNLKNVMTRLQSKQFFRAEIKEFDTDPFVLNCKNGVIDLKTGELLPHSPDQKITHYIPVEYDFNADWSAWHKWISDTAKGGEADAEWLRKAVGYSITGSTREEVLFYIYGPTRGGKGTFTETILALLGRSLSDELPFSTFTRKDDGNSQNHDLAPLKPHRFIAASESNSYERFNEARVKHLTGGNIIRCAFKFKTHFSYRPQFKIWLSSNEEINADPDDDAVWGRLRVIEFPHSRLGKEDKTLKQRFKDPEFLKGVLAWAVRGALEWQRDGLPESATMAAAKAAQRARRDTVQEFLNDTADRPDTEDQDGNVTPYEGYSTPSTDLYKAYKAWCFDNGVSAKQQRGLTDALKRKGYTTGRDSFTKTVYTKDGEKTVVKRERCVFGVKLT